MLVRLQRWISGCMAGLLLSILTIATGANTHAADNVNYCEIAGQKYLQQISDKNTKSPDISCGELSPDETLYLAVEHRDWDIDDSGIDIDILVYDIVSKQLRTTRVPEFMDREDTLGFNRDGIGLMAYWVGVRRFRVGYSVADPHLWSTFWTFTLNGDKLTINDAGVVHHGARIIRRTRRFLVTRQEGDRTTRFTVVRRIDGRVHLEFEYVDLWQGPEVLVMESLERITFRSACGETRGGSISEKIESLGREECQRITKESATVRPSYIHTYDLNTGELTVESENGGRS